MPDLPKYALWVAERRFRVDGANLPPLNDAEARRIEDLYIDGGRLRLRRIVMPGGAPDVFKLAKKYAAENPLLGPMTNLYLTAEEYAVLNVLPGARLAKRRHKVGAFVVDVFEGPLAGLVLAECEASNSVAAMAFDVPAWCGREVTDDIAFTGARLAQTGVVPA